MSEAVDFAAVAAQTAERLRDPVAHFRDLDLMLPQVIPGNLDHLRGALAALLELGVPALARDPLAFGLAELCAADRVAGIQSAQDYLAGFVYGVQQAQVIDGALADRLRALVNRAASVLFADEMARIRRRHRARQVRARQPGGAPCPTN
ncbi:hypothetical protein V0R55_24750 [Pseudomonas soli]|uniref:Uncharacterized protein n=1 Tax=Pseudomonas soli TaxID=1306993 RepID=A0ABU7GWE3_9PSED|nr:hypothetical protein [Pseudomonas soli]MEE1883378.1 hypothetical protein [Pseudomonas soli]